MRVQTQSSNRLTLVGYVVADVDSNSNHGLKFASLICLEAVKSKMGPLLAWVLMNGQAQVWHFSLDLAST